MGKILVSLSGKVLVSLIVLTLICAMWGPSFYVTDAEAITTITLLSGPGETVSYGYIPGGQTWPNFRTTDYDGDGVTIAEMYDGDWEISYLRSGTWHYAMVTIVGGEVDNLDDYYEWHNQSTWYIVDDTTISNVRFILLLSGPEETVSYGYIPGGQTWPNIRTTDYDGNGVTIAKMYDGDWEISYLRNGIWYYAMIAIVGGRVDNLDDYYEWHNQSTWYIVDDTTVSNVRFILLSEPGETVSYGYIPVGQTWPNIRTTDYDGDGVSIAEMYDGNWEISYLRDGIWHYAMATVVGGRIDSVDDNYAWHNQSAWHKLTDMVLVSVKEDNHGDYVSTVAIAVDALVVDGILSEEEADDIVSSAAKSTHGMPDRSQKPGKGYK